MNNTANKLPEQSFPYIWIDLEMTGLDPERDVILEIATIITDANLTVQHEGPHFIIHQSEDVLNSMNQWCIEHHGKSGLTQAVRESTTSLELAQIETLAFIKRFCPRYVGRLCGNSVWQDRLFLSRYMPELIAHLNYRMVDVTSVKELIRRWYPTNAHLEFAKEEKHRALPDIVESIKELQHYRQHFFIP